MTDLVSYLIVYGIAWFVIFMILAGSHANGQIGLKRKDLILPYMLKMPRELSKDVFTSLGNSVRGTLCLKICS